MISPILVNSHLFQKIQDGRNNAEFPKTFLERYLFALVEYLCNRSPKMRTRSFKNYISTLTIENYRNFLNALSPLTVHLKKC